MTHRGPFQPLPFCDYQKNQKKVYQKKFYHLSSRSGLYNWDCICLNLKRKRVSKPNYTEFHRKSMLFSTITFATAHKKKHLFEAFSTQYMVMCADRSV